jgi:hypothetical protein
MDHMKLLNMVATRDVATLVEKEKTYKGSWKKRGGVGAFMMLARKWDRIENMMVEGNYDIFKKIEDDMSGNDGTILAEIRDLRCYLMLVEAEILARSKEPRYPGTPEDGGHHAWTRPRSPEEQWGDETQ